MKLSLKRSAGVAAFVLVAFAIVGCNSSDAASKGKVGSAVSANLMRTLRTVSQQNLMRKVEPATVSLQAISGPTLGSGKPIILYIGADFCPYCAAVRWPLVVALLRFGTFDGLRYMRSSSTDVYANTVTFSFHGAHYHSDYIAFDAVDIADRQGKTLSKPSGVQQAVFQQFDVAPHTKVPGAIPFLYVGGRYLEIGAPFSAGLLSSLSWQNIARQLKAGQTDLSIQIIGAANVYTAAICGLTDGKPAKVCSSTAVETAKSKLPK